MVDPQPSFGIIGGGFSGIAVAINLIRKATVPITLSIIEQNTEWGGVAYGTKDPHHPLNVRALHMGLLAEAPEGFYHWLKESDRWRTLHSAFRSLEVNPHSFIPRMIYALYLKECFEEARTAAWEKGIDVRVIFDKAEDVNVDTFGSLKIQLSSGGTIPVDRLILATGIAPTQSLPFENAALLNDSRYIANAWDPVKKSVLGAAYANEGDILVIGTGLTMVDVVTSLIGNGGCGRILAVSPSGHLPEAHLSSFQVKWPSTHRVERSTHLLDLVKRFRQEVAKASQEGHDWRTVIDTLRPSIPRLWQRLPLAEKKQFLRHLFSVWNKHRHRTAPESSEIVRQLIRNHRLQIIAGRVKAIDCSHPQELRVTLDHQSFIVHHAINCSGPEYVLSRQSPSVVQNLLKRDLVRPDSLGLGLALASDGSLDNRVPGKIFALGSLLFGELLETTAVPEIREQAAAIATHLLQK